MNWTKLTTVLLLGATVLGCSLETEPAQEIDSGQALSSDANVKATLVGAYNALAVNDLYGGNIQRDADLLGGVGELLFVGTFNGPREISNQAISVGNNDAQERWIEGYETVNIANNVLSALDVVEEADRDRIEGEARFIRGLLHFDLVRFFGQPVSAGESGLGIPIITTPTSFISAESNVSRATVGAVYDQVIDDLTQAASLLPADNGFFASRGAANAILARAHLQRGDFAAARDAANAVIASGEYELTDTYADAFMNDENSSEDVFAIQVSNQDGVNNLNLFYSIPSFGGRDGDIEVLPRHLERYEEGDARAALFFDNAGSTLTGKFNSQFANVSVVRLAELYLIRAEANERLGTEVGATPAEDIALLRSRAGLETDEDDVDLDFILGERRKELAFEGFLIHDIKRLGETVGSLPATADELVFPIPAREIVANPNLVQNPGYN